ncbi:MAG: hypothetical protein H7Y11_13340, partial [Armatimonadetes bacterium]|nr:hypothetical protein [Anaerolineae bacterium]
GGAATPSPLLYLGLGLLVALMVFFGLLAWWLFYSPVPAGKTAKVIEASPVVKQVVVILVIASSVLMFVGSFWDEVWHRTYGIPFGEDFFWRPHIMIYISIGLMAAFALGGMALIMRGRGDLRRRFRADPSTGLLALGAVFIMFVVPLDPLWHEVYGVDLTAWSLPHIMLFGGYSLVTLSAIALQLSLVPKVGWRGLGNFSLADGLMVLLAVGAFTMMLQLTTAEWEGRAINAPINGPFLLRPLWLYPVVITMLASFVGALLINATHRVGLVTLTALLALALRMTTITVFNTEPLNMTINATLIAVPIFIALDVWYFVRLRSADTRLTQLGAGVAVWAATCLVGIPLIAALVVYPQVNAETLPGMVVFSLVIAVAAHHAGAMLGNTLRNLGGASSVSEPATVRTGDVRQMLGVGLAALVVGLLFVAWFVSTATPPTLGV